MSIAPMEGTGQLRRVLWPQAVTKLRQIEVLVGAGKSIGQACKEAGNALTKGLSRAGAHPRHVGFHRDRELLRRTGDDL